MSNIINLQLSVFCNKHIEATPEKITTLMGGINSVSGLMFLPSVVNGQNINILIRQVTNVSNLAFITANQQFQILCTDNRIDVTFNTSAETPLDYEQHLEIAAKLLEFIMSEEAIIGSRLAFNTQIVGAENIDNVSERIAKYGKPLNFYEGRPVEEWSLRYNSRESIDMAGMSELLNIITNLSIAQNIGTSEKRILCHMDINTLAEQIAFRFSFKSVSLFTASIMPIIDEIKANFGSIEND